MIFVPETLRQVLFCGPAAQEAFLEEDRVGTIGRGVTHIWGLI